MKVIKLALVLAFLAAVGLGCGGKGGGGPDFDACVKAGMDQIQKQSGNAPPSEAKGPVETSCQICKDKPGSDECKMIVEALQK